LKKLTALLIAVIIAGTISGAYYYTYSVLPQPSVPTSTSSSFPSQASSPSEPAVQPTQSLNPSSEVMTDEVRNSILDINSSFPINDLNTHFSFFSPPYVRGKILVWDIMSNKEFTDVEMLMPSNILAQSPDENITVFAVFIPQDPTSNVYVIAVYFPEGILVGPETIAIDYSRENAVNRVLAEWITSLDKNDHLPLSSHLEAIATIADMWDLIEAANSTYSSFPNATLPVLIGEVLVWDCTRNFESRAVEELLPPELVADSFEGETTVFAIVKEKRIVVGYYEGFIEATRVYWDILVIHCPEKEVVGLYTVQGLYPKSVITIPLESFVGDINRPTAEWILSLPR
jgi:hypothetical protein